MALLLHDANCPHCRKALPELNLVAKALTKEDVPWQMAGERGLGTGGKGSFKG